MLSISQVHLLNHNIIVGVNRVMELGLWELVMLSSIWGVVFLVFLIGLKSGLSPG